VTHAVVQTNGQFRAPVDALESQQFFRRCALSARSYSTNAAPGFATNWCNAPSVTNHPVTVPAALPTKFYRLFKP
jgi:hypothetical protein